MGRARTSVLGFPVLTHSRVTPILVLRTGSQTPIQDSKNLLQAGRGRERAFSETEHTNGALDRAHVRTDL